MRRKKKTAKFFVCVLVLLLFLGLIIPAGAYKPSPYLTVFVRLEQLPEGTACVDLLIPAGEADDYFVEKTEPPTTLSLIDASTLEYTNESEIALYNDGGYSYLMHFKGSSISFSPGAQGEIQIDYGTDENLLDVITEKENCRFAFVDDAGNILAVSDPFTIENNFFKDFSCAKLNGLTVKTEYQTNFYRVAAGVLGVAVLAAIVGAVFAYLKIPCGCKTMKSNLLKKFGTPEISLILMCCVPAVHIAVRNRLVSLPIIFALAVLVIFLSLKRLLKRSRTDRKSRLLLIFEIMGSVLLCTVYGFVYDKITPENVVNLVFVLASLVFLIPFIAEIATAREN